MKLAKIVLAMSLTVAASLAIMAKPASAATRLSGVSVWNACKSQNKLAYFELAISPYNVMGWKCRVRASDGTSYIDFGVDLSRQCRAQHPGKSVYADYTNFSDPYSWGCYQR